MWKIIVTMVLLLLIGCTTGEDCPDVKNTRGLSKTSASCIGPSENINCLYKDDSDQNIIIAATDTYCDQGINTKFSCEYGEPVEQGPCDTISNICNEDGSCNGGDECNYDFVCKSQLEVGGLEQDCYYGDYCDPGLKCNVSQGKCKEHIEWIDIPQGIADSKSVGPFKIMKTEVTNGQYVECVNHGPCNSLENIAELVEGYDYISTWNQLNSDDLPVDTMPFEMAGTYCSWIGGRLPTWNEWLFVGTNLSQTYLPWGDEPHDSCDYFALPKAFDCVSDDPTGCFPDFEKICPPTLIQEPCKFPKGNTSLGVCDMMGNVAEWTSNCIDDYCVILGRPFLTISENTTTLSANFGDWFKGPLVGPVFATGMRCVKDSLAL